MEQTCKGCAAGTEIFKLVGNPGNPRVSPRYLGGNPGSQVVSGLEPVSLL